MSHEGSVVRYKLTKQDHAMQWGVGSIPGSAGHRSRTTTRAMLSMTLMPINSSRIWSHLQGKTLSSQAEGSSQQGSAEALQGATVACLMRQTLPFIRLGSGSL